MTLDELMNELASDFPDISAIMGENDSVVLGSVECGSTILIGDRSYIVLEHRNDGTTAVITKDFWKDMEFDNDSGDYAESAVRNALNTEFYNEVSSEIGDENIITHEVDTTRYRNDGIHSSCRDKVSLLTVDLYRRYRKLLPAYGSWWWTATPYSMEYPRCVCFVYGDGALSWSDCSYYGGVRPFLILDSSVSNFSVLDPA